MEFKKIYGVNFVDLDTLLKKSEIVSLHLPLSNKSKNILSREKIDLLKNKSVIINTSRSGLIDNKALSIAIKKQNVFGAGLDCLESDEIKYFKGLKNVILTPHIAGITNESINRMDLDLAKMLEKFIIYKK